MDALLRFLNPDVVPDWLTTEQFQLRATPIDPLKAGRLADVLQTANATEQGAYV